MWSLAIKKAFSHTYFYYHFPREEIQKSLRKQFFQTCIYLPQAIFKQFHGSWISDLKILANC
jgi:hypothetical protein